MITPEIRDIYCSDLDNGVEPLDPADVYLAISATIGMPGEVGADQYNFIFVTPIAFQRLSREAKQQIDPFKIVERFRWDEAERYIKEKCEASAGYDSTSMCNQLRKWSHWEYEGYR